MLSQDERQAAAHDTCSLAEVLAGGFEARCVGPDGARYLWCKGAGLRIDRRTNMTTLVIDPSSLPDVVWFPTRFGLRQLAERQTEAGAAYVRSGAAEEQHRE